MCLFRLILFRQQQEGGNLGAYLNAPVLHFTCIVEVRSKTSHRDGRQNVGLATYDFCYAGRAL